MKKVLAPSNKKLRVINPITGQELKEDGEKVTIDKYWRRRIKDKEVIEVKEKKESFAKKENKEDKKENISSKKSKES